MLRQPGKSSWMSRETTSGELVHRLVRPTLSSRRGSRMGLNRRRGRADLAGHAPTGSWGLTTGCGVLYWPQ